MIGSLAITFAAIFFGAAFYLSIAEHPARQGLPVGATLAEWKPSYQRGFMMQASIAVLSGACGLIMWWIEGGPLWLAGAITILANWPYTLIVMMPVNHRLEATPSESANDETRQLLNRWGRLHWVRTILGGAATMLLLFATR